MGQDVDRTLFSRRDRQSYRSKVQRCLDALTLMLREHPFAHDEPMTGVEVELNLVDDGELVPARTSSPSWAGGTWSSTCRRARCRATSGASSSTSSPTSSASRARPPTRAGRGSP